jgi:putative DNA primase/helicase
MVPAIREIPLAALGRALGQAARWMRFDRYGKLQRIDPPRPVVEMVAEMPEGWPFPGITGLVRSPSLRRDLSLLDREGFDPETGLFADFAGLEVPKIPARPSRAEADAALGLLKSILDDFPFADGENGPSQAVALSGLITPCVRSALDVAPIHTVTAPAGGTGKSYLVDLISTIATGERAAVLSYGVSAEESEKRLIGAALKGHPLIVVDNARRLLVGDFMCQLVERRLLQLRPLGTSDEHQILNNFTMFATGNQLGVADDMVRRSLRCALDANVENPHKRQHRNRRLREDVAARRGEYLRACLVIVLYYAQAGKPNALPWLASFGEWSDLVRSALHFLGTADPVASMEALEQADPVRERRAEVFAAWREARLQDLEARDEAGFATRELIGLTKGGGAAAEAFREVLLELAGGKGQNSGVIDPKRVGEWMRWNEGTVANGLKLICDRSNTQKPRWQLSPVEP